MVRKRAQARMDELLSAYLDGELSPGERARLEARLEADPALRERLEGLRQTVALVRDLPRVQPPRNFLLTPSMVASPRPRPAPRRWLAPALTFATAVSGLLCVIVLAGSLLARGVGLPAASAPVEAPYEVAMEQTVEAERAIATVVYEAPEEDTAVVEGAEEAPASLPELPPPGMAVATPTAAGEEEMVAGTPSPQALAGAAPPSTATPTPGAAREPVATGAPPPRLAVTPEEGAPPPAVEVWTLPLLVCGLPLLTLGLAVAAVLAWRARRR